MCGSATACWSVVLITVSQEEQEILNRNEKQPRFWIWELGVFRFLSLSAPSVSAPAWNFPAVGKSRPIVTAQPGVSPCIPLTSHATQTHKHAGINTRARTRNCTRRCPASKGRLCLPGGWWGWIGPRRALLPGRCGTFCRYLEQVIQMIIFKAGANRWINWSG